MGVDIVGVSGFPTQGKGTSQGFAPAYPVVTNPFPSTRITLRVSPYWWSPCDHGAHRTSGAPVVVICPQSLFREGLTHASVQLAAVLGRDEVVQNEEVAATCAASAV